MRDCAVEIGGHERRALCLSDLELTRLLDLLDAQDAQRAAGPGRRAYRVCDLRFRTHCGVTRSEYVVSRWIDAAQLGFLSAAYCQPGMSCEVELPTGACGKHLQFGLIAASRAVNTCAFDTTVCFGSQLIPPNIPSPST